MLDCMHRYVRKESYTPFFCLPGAFFHFSLSFCPSISSFVYIWALLKVILMIVVDFFIKLDVALAKCQRATIQNLSRQNEETITNDKRMLSDKFDLECLLGLSGFDHCDQVCHVCNSRSGPPTNVKQ